MLARVGGQFCIRADHIFHSGAASGRNYILFAWTSIDEIMPLLLRTFAWLLEFKRHAKPRCLVALPGLWPSRSFSEYGTQLGPKSVRVHKVLEKETVALNSVRHRGRPRMALPIYRHFCRKVGTGIV